MQCATLQSRSAAISSEPHPSTSPQTPITTRVHAITTAWSQHHTKKVEELPCTSCVLPHQPATCQLLLPPGRVLWLVHAPSVLCGALCCLLLVLSQEACGNKNKVQHFSCILQVKNTVPGPSKTVHALLLIPSRAAAGFFSKLSAKLGFKNPYGPYGTLTHRGSVGPMCAALARPGQASGLRYLIW